MCDDQLRTIMKIIRFTRLYEASYRYFHWSEMCLEASVLGSSLPVNSKMISIQIPCKNAMKTVCSV